MTTTSPRRGAGEAERLATDGATLRDPRLNRYPVAVPTLALGVWRFRRNGC